MKTSKNITKKANSLQNKVTKEKALFLGPKAENQELYESLIVEVIRDACFLRKNFHPEDKALILESDKLDPVYQETAANMKEHLYSILAELKKSVPWYHPRYIGHMFGDLMLPSIIGYFSTMLYNPNNVVGEVSTATTRMELEFIDSLCKMVGYGPCTMSGKNAWGHLCSGGTVANIEALWVARNLKYYPLSVKLASESGSPKAFLLRDISFDYFQQDIKNLTYNQLFNLRTSDILNLDDHITLRCKQEGFDIDEIEQLIRNYSVEKIGVHAIHKITEVSLPVVYISKSSHYSWKKAMDILGVGQRQLIEVDMDNGYRMSFDDFKTKVTDAPILAVVGILGSTKQGSLYPIDELVKYRNELENREKRSFYLHIDGAYGGYLCSLFKKNEEEFFTSIDALHYLLGEKSFFQVDGNEESTININWCNKILSVKNADSITIDPHKMGYIPYPAGAILFKDTRAKSFISYTPSYLNKPSDESNLELAFLGQWTVEGSRPGAVATSCYLTNKVMPLNKDAHGLLIKNSILAANNFWETIMDFNSNSELNHGFKVVPTYVPEFNIVSYVLCSPDKIKQTKYLNILTHKLFEKFSISKGTIIPAQNFIVAKEDFGYDDIPKGTLLEKCGIDENDPGNKKENIFILSSVFMNPLSCYLEENFYMMFFKEMVYHAQNIMPEVLLEILKDKEGGRVNVLWVEDDDLFLNMKKDLQHDIDFGRFLNIDFKDNFQDANKAIENNEYDVYLFDLNISNKNHKTYKPKDIQLVEKLINKIPNETKNRILFYSQYFSDEFTNFQAKEELKSKGFSEDRFIAKTIDNDQGFYIDIKSIIDGFFRILNK
ncbi:MAG: pyridoxal-dependent decarboxylase [Acholeplasmataceae bacterium]|nr:pyridoxal-dependent decarboxylase [Acholeplasmataceae bacterium]